MKEHSYMSVASSLSHTPFPCTVLFCVVTCSVEGEDVSLALGSTLRCVGLRAAAGAPPAFPLRRDWVLCWWVQVYVTKEKQTQNQIKTKSNDKLSPGFRYLSYSSPIISKHQRSVYLLVYKRQYIQLTITGTATAECLKAFRRCVVKCHCERDL